MLSAPGPAKCRSHFEIPPRAVPVECHSMTQHMTHTLFDKALAAGPALLCRLEEELDSPLQVLLHTLQQLRSSQQHCHVAVMATRMAFPRHFAPAEISNNFYSLPSYFLEK